MYYNNIYKTHERNAQLFLLARTFLWDDGGLRRDAYSFLSFVELFKFSLHCWKEIETNQKTSYKKWPYSNKKKRTLSKLFKSDSEHDFEITPFEFGLNFKGFGSMNKVTESSSMDLELFEDISMIFEGVDSALWSNSIILSLWNQIGLDPQIFH